MSNTQALYSPGHIYRTLINQFWITDSAASILGETPPTSYRAFFRFIPYLMEHKPEDLNPKSKIPNLKSLVKLQGLMDTH